MAKGKILIECPECSRINEASVGFFSKKKIVCACGTTIDISQARMITKECPKCGNLIVYDKAKNRDPICPVCKEHLLSHEEDFKFVEVICDECSTHITAKKDDSYVTCPVCGNSIDVQKRLKEQEYKNKSQPLILKSDSSADILVVKHRVEDFGIGSQIIVNDSQIAIFVSDGKTLGVIESGKYSIEQDNVFLSKENFDDNTVSFKSQVYFISKSIQSNIKWGTDSKVRMFDPATGLHVELGACGFFNFFISDPSKFLFETIGVNAIDEYGLSAQDFANKLKPNITKIVKSDLAKEIRENGINILEVDEYTKEISEKLLITINKEICKYGIQLQEFIISTIITPDDDPNFKRMKEQLASRYLRVQEEKIGAQVADARHDRVMAETRVETDAEIARAQARAQADLIIAQGKASSYAAQAQAEAAEMRLKGYTYKDETQRMVAQEAVKNPSIATGSGSQSVGFGITEMATESVKAGVIKEIGKEITGQVVGAMNPKIPSGWECVNCHTKNITSNFCPNCGNKKPEEKTPWNCPVCGATNISTNFCPDCGNKKPEESATWICPDCGTKDISTNFCPNCGRKK